MPWDIKKEKPKKVKPESIMGVDAIEFGKQYRFEFKGGGLNKFWIVKPSASQKGSSILHGPSVKRMSGAFGHVVAFGRNGTNGQEKGFVDMSYADCIKEVKKKIDTKIKKGYKFVSVK